MATKLIEDNFKVCGLCTQLVDESVMLPGGLRSFLVDFLRSSLPDQDWLPTKTCLECYQHASESKRFKDRCDRSIAKLSKSEVYSSMVLGRSHQDRKAAASFVVETTNNVIPKSSKAQKSSNKKSKAGPASKKRSLLGLEIATIDVDTSAGRASRSQTAVSSTTPATGLRSRGPSSNVKPVTPTNRRSSKVHELPRAKKRSGSGRHGGHDGTNPCRVMIKAVEKQRADKAYKKHGVVRNTTGHKRGNLDLATPPAPKRLRKGYAMVPDTSPPPAVAAEDPLASRSSFGRARKPLSKKGYVYDSPVDTNPAEESDEDTPVARRKRGSSPNKANNKQQQQKAGYYFVDEKGDQVEKKEKKTKKKKASESEDVEVDVEEDEGSDEVFPSIGPYQCEICQAITDTKAEFVGHIKQFHRDVVDEEVLRSLESDLRKSQQANKKKKKKKTPAPAANKKLKTPKQKTGPKTSKKKKKQVEQPKKIATPSPKKDNVSTMCNICQTVLARSAPSEMVKHQATRACRMAAAEAKQKEQAEVNDIDPLSDDKTENDEDVASRTCQYCSKVVDNAKDLNLHYSTKACMAKKYVMENGNSQDNEEEEEDAATPTVVMENAEEDIVPQQGDGLQVTPDSTHDNLVPEDDSYRPPPEDQIMITDNPISPPQHQHQHDLQQAQPCVSIPVTTMNSLLSDHTPMNLHHSGMAAEHYLPSPPVIVHPANGTTDASSFNSPLF